ncbi:MAG: hypothetical protein EOP48_24240, partial [Sphingobacteriales bacterium]
MKKKVFPILFSLIAAGCYDEKIEITPEYIINEVREFSIIDVRNTGRKMKENFILSFQVKYYFAGTAGENLRGPPIQVIRRSWPGWATSFHVSPLLRNAAWRVWTPAMPPRSKRTCTASAPTSAHT